MAAAPDLAAAVEARFAAHIHHVIGTLRRDGAPRLSGTEVQIEDGRLRVGMMPGSHKLADIRRDPRVEITARHWRRTSPLAMPRSSAAFVTGHLPDGGQPSSMFELDIELVSLVRVDGDELEFTTWRPDRGVRTNHPKEMTWRTVRLGARRGLTDIAPRGQHHEAHAPEGPLCLTAAASVTAVGGSAGGFVLALGSTDSIMRDPRGTSER